MRKWNHKIFIGFFALFIFLCRVPAQAETLSLVPVGQTVGVVLDMKGVTIVDTTDVKDYDNKRHTPAKDAGLRSGDRIQSINGIPVQSAKQLEELVNTLGEKEINITFERESKQLYAKATAALSQKDGHYRLGVWIKDAASGIGTITYYNPSTMEFGALGHGIAEDAQTMIAIRGGDLWNANVVSVQKGSKGHPGELLGVFSENDQKLGEIKENSKVGLKGTLSQTMESLTGAIPVAQRTEVEEGDAEIFSNIEENKVESFAIKIQKINKDTENTKGMIFKVIDDRLLEKTGGIVQGMSGSPIIQKGKLVGAVTHVLVNDPTRGYGIFIETMLE